MNYAIPFQYKIPTEILFGPGTLSQLGEIVLKYSKRVMIVTFESLKVTAGVCRMLEDQGAEVNLFNGIRPNPLIETVDQVARVAKKSGSEVIVGLGGGSSIDTAKLVSVLVPNGGKSWDYTIEMGDERREITVDPLPLIAIPTTSGTGSEVSHVSVLTNPLTKQKGPVVSTKICPRCALVDPELSMTMPDRVTAATGFDAFTHAFERFMGPVSFSFIELLAKDAMKLVIRNIDRVLTKPEDIEARSAMAWASTQAGFCLLGDLGESGLHVFSLPVSAIFDVSHGEALSACMPMVLEQLSKTVPDKVSSLADVLHRGMDTVGPAREDKCTGVVRQMEQWLKDIGLNRRLSDFGIKASDMGTLAKSINLNRLSSAWGRDISIKEVQELYQQCL